MNAPNRNATVLRHEEVAGLLRDEILHNYQPGERLPPDTANADRFGVSVVTLRDAMRLLVKEGLLTRRRGSGTYVRDRSQDSLARVAILCREDLATHSASPYGRLVLQALQRRIRAARFVPEVHFEVDGNVETQSILRESPDSPLTGLVVLNPIHDDRTLERVTGLGIPVVSCNQHFPGGFKASNDNSGLVRDAVHYLHDHGRSRLALVTLNKVGSVHPGVDDWMEESFLAALARHGLTFNSDWVCGVSPTDGPGAAFDAVHQLWEAKRERPDGLLVTDDTIYPEVAMALLELDVVVPEDLLVISHANLGARMFCPFPTVRFAFDPARMANVLVDALCDLIAGNTPSPPFTVLPFHIIEPEGEMS